MKKIKMVTIPFRISSVLYFLMGFGMLILAAAGFSEKTEDAFLAGSLLVFMALFCIAIGVFVEIVIYNFKKKKYWAWISALIISALYIPSLFIVLGIIPLIAILDKETKDEFDKARGIDNPSNHPLPNIPKPLG